MRGGHDRAALVLADDNRQRARQGRRAHRVGRRDPGRHASDHAGRGRPPRRSLARRPARRARRAIAAARASTASSAPAACSSASCRCRCSWTMSRSRRSTSPPASTSATPKSCRRWPTRAPRSSPTACWWPARSRPQRRDNSSPRRRAIHSTPALHARRRVVRVPAARGRRRHDVLRAWVDRRVVAHGDPGSGAELAAIAAGAIALALAASFWVARMLTEPVGRLSESLAPDEHLARRQRPPAARRIEPRAGRADRDVQRADGVGREGGGTDAGGVHGRDSRAGDGTRCARSVYRRPFRSRQRPVGGDRPGAQPAGGRASRSSGWARCFTTSARSACRTPCC